MGTAEARSEICLKGRREMSISGVTEVIGFDEECVRLKSVDGELFVEGRDIKIGALDTDRGVVTLTGTVNGIYYAAEPDKQRKGFFGRLMS